MTALDTGPRTTSESARTGRGPVKRAISGRRKRSQTAVVLLFSAPAFAAMLIFLIIPTFESVQYSFYDWNGLSPATPIGFGNFVELFTDATFLQVAIHSLLLALIGTVGSVGVGLVWAYAIERRLPGWRAYRFLLFIPVVMPTTVSALLWALLLDTNGPIDSLLSTLGVKAPPDWLGDFRIALGTVIFVAIWQASGFTMLLILGAMEDVPAELHDAGSLDGAGALRRLVSIVLPQIRGTVATVAVVQFVGLLKAFDIVFALTRGGPGGSTDVFGTYLTQKAFAEGRYGYGSTIAVAMTVLLLVINVVLYRRLLGKENR